MRQLQVDTQRPLVRNTPFPDLPLISSEDALRLIQKMSTNKALTFSFMSDIIFSKNLQTQTANIIRDLWKSDVLNNLPSVYFEARLIALNKKHPEIPKPSEFRPIVIMSALTKIIEGRLLEKLQDYLSNKLARSQVGFVPSMDIYVNIHRAIKQILKRTSNKSHAFCLFLDFKSAYNTVPHDKLFLKLERICDYDEIALIKAVYFRLTIKLGEETLTCNTGVAQGSMISPALFDIYAEDLILKLMDYGWSLEDLLAFAGDHLFICDTEVELLKVIDLTNDWCQRSNITLNPAKSGILEVIPRRGKPSLSGIFSRRNSCR